MPTSDKQAATPGYTLAVIAEALYLVNLLLLPGIGFMLLLLLYLITIREAAPLAKAHLQQTLVTSLWGGFLLVIINLLIIFMGGYQSVNTWIIVILYFTVIHASFVLLGAIGLSHALSAQCWRFPVFGPAPGKGCESL